MSFEGHLHSGIDDTRNIARIVVRMLEDGCNLRANEQLFPQRLSASVTSSQGAKSNRKCDCSESLSDVCHKHSKNMLSGAALDSLSGNLSELCLNCGSNGKLQAAAQNGVGINDNDYNDEEDDEIDDLMSYYAIQQS